MSRKLTVAVTGLNAHDNPGPGVGVIRSLKDSKEFNIRIVGLSYETMEPGPYLHDIVDVAYQIPYPSAGSDPLKENLNFIIPNFDAELRNFIRLAKVLAENGISTLLPKIEDLNSIDKTQLNKFCEKHNIESPKTMLLNSIDKIPEIEDQLDFPVYVKGLFYEAYKANNPDQVKTYFTKLSAKWGLPVIVQESIDGTEINIAGLGDGKGNLMGAVPIRKLYITDRGKGWSGVVLSDTNLIDISKDFAKASKWTGGFELEFIRTMDDKLVLLEVNPRFPAWIYTATAAGQNLPEALLKLGLDLPIVPMENYEAGKMFIRYAWELITDISEFQRFSTQGVLYNQERK
jgi:carbamoyl-phosphate synthase large subunit